MILQRTLKQTVQVSGVGLHSGHRVRLVLHPAAIDHGIVFRRVDVVPRVDIPAHPQWVNDTRLSSTLVKDNVRVGTIEHLMSALAALGLDNLLIELDAPEIPIMDGSAAPFLYLLQAGGVVEQRAAKKFVQVLKPIEVVDGDKWVRLEPHAGFKVCLGIQFAHPAVARTQQEVSIDFAETSFVSAIARARTFGFMHEVDTMRSMGLGLGGSLDNAIVMDEQKVLNNEGLRYPDEFVRHKILDAIGDLYILGHPLIAAFSGYKSGHAMNNRLLRTLLADASAWREVSFAHEDEAPSAFHQLQPDHALA